MTIYPAILTDSPDTVAKQLELSQQSDDVSTVQIDIIDGLFADNITITPADLVGMEFDDLTVDLHLMTEEPLDFVYEAKDCKAELPVRAVIGQVERLSNQLDFLREVRNEGWKAGLSLNLFTPVEAIEEESWEFIDVVQVMGIEAGFQGQSFHPTALETLKEVALKISQTDRDIEVIVDGGVELALLPKLQNLNVDGVVVGSALWNAKDFEDTVREFASQ